MDIFELAKARKMFGGKGGGGSDSGGDASQLDALIARTLTEIESNAEKVGIYAFYYNNVLTTADFPLATSIGTYAFSGCSALSTLILRSETACTLSSTNAFNSTPIASGTGYIYAPSALVESYKAATNWSTYAAQFRALEDYTVDGTITGELDPDKI